MKNNTKLSLSRYTTYLIYGFIIVLGSLVISTLSVQINREIWNSHEVNFIRENEIKRNEIYSYLNTRKITLSDYASFPIIRQAVMQPNINIANIRDFLHDLSILNERNKLALLDFEGNIISDNTLEPIIDYSNQTWVEDIIDNKIDAYTKIFEYNSKYYWRIALPVLYNSLPEGILVMEFPFENLFKDKNSDSYSGLKEVFRFNNKNIFTIGNVEKGKIRQFYLEDLNLTVELTSDSQNIENGIKKLIIEVFIIMSIISILGVSVLLFYLRKYVVSPITKLTGTTLDMVDGNYSNSFNVNDYLLEIHDLKENYNEMVNVIVEREYTLQKRKEKAIKKNTLLHCTLEQLKATQAQLLQQEKLASIGQLAAGVAHELNNPLGFVSGNFAVLKDYITILNEYIKLNESLITKHLPSEKNIIEEFKESNDIEFISEDLNSLFEESEEGIQRAIKIVKNLKDFSRIDSEEKSLYDLNKGIESTINVAKNEYQYVADIATNLEDLPIIEANGGEINQVILNILVNAAQAISEMKLNEKRKITITTSKNDSFIFCEIEDNGPGMSDTVKKRVFDPFFTTKEIGKGTGLGLNISYNIIVKKHKGNLSVESEIGKGTKFIIKLPIN